MAVMDPRDAFVLNPVGAHTANSSLSSAATISIPDGATKIIVQALDQNIRYTVGGTAPTTTLGFQLKAGDPPIMVPIGAGTSFKFIEETTTATLQYQFAS